MKTFKPSVRRSAHFVPGPNEKMLTKSVDSDADMLILDLEDAVAPSDKERAREIIANWLETVDFGTKEIAVRINPLDTPWGVGDVQRLMQVPLDLLMVPKAERLTAIQALDSLMRRCRPGVVDENERVGLFLICNETPLGFASIGALATEPRVVALTWGAEDLSASVGSSEVRGSDGRYLSMFEQARTETLIAASTYGLTPIDTVYVQLGDTIGLSEECRQAAQLGFSGKLTIHPEQIDIVNEAFTPSIEEVNRAKRLIEAFAEVQDTGQNAFRFEGQMVDAPHLTRAKALLSKAAITGTQ